jgi:hypothetical protein
MRYAKSRHRETVQQPNMWKDQGTVGQIPKAALMLPERPMQEPTAALQSCTANAFTGTTSCMPMHAVHQPKAPAAACPICIPDARQKGLKPPCCMSMHAVQQANTCSGYDLPAAPAARQVCRPTCTAEALNSPCCMSKHPCWPTNQHLLIL